jgi:hypothetical protein
VGLLEISVAAGEAGPVLTLSGEADLTTVAELTEALTAQLAIGTRHLTVDLHPARDSPTTLVPQSAAAPSRSPAEPPRCDIVPVITATM